MVKNPLLSHTEKGMRHSADAMMLMVARDDHARAANFKNIQRLGAKGEHYRPL
jgi:hypothetical protein